MKKIISFLFVLFVAVSANAQFREGTKYVNASLSNLGFSYSKADRFRFGLQLDAGYYIADRWSMLMQVISTRKPLMISSLVQVFATTLRRMVSSLELVPNCHIIPKEALTFTFQQRWAIRSSSITTSPLSQLFITR